MLRTGVLINKKAKKTPKAPKENSVKSDDAVKLEVVALGKNKQNKFEKQTQNVKKDVKTSKEKPIQSVEREKSEVVALEKKKQSKFEKRIQNVKKDVKSGDIEVKENVTTTPKKKQRGVVYVGHIPHGFYEQEMKAYFKQFGKVSNVMVSRSKKTGKSMGYGYIEFLHPDVAKIAAETMDNYVMFKRRIVAQYIPPEKVKRGLFKMKISKTNPPKMRNRRATNNLKNAPLTKAKHTENAKKKISKIEKKMQQLKELGVDYNFTPSFIPKSITNTENPKSKEEKEIKSSPVKPKKKVKKETSIVDVSPVKKSKKTAIISKTVPTKPKKDNKDVLKAKSSLMKLAAKELLKNSDHIITTRSTMKLGKKNKKRI